MTPGARSMSILLAAIMLTTMLPIAAETRPEGYVFSVTVSSQQQLDIVLDRAEDLRELFDPDQHSRIAIVLHGDELP